MVDLLQLLDRFSGAVRSGDIETATTLLDDIEARYQAVEATERADQRRAVAGRDNTGTSAEARERLDSYAQGVVATDLGRAALLTGGALYVTDPAQVDEAEFADRTSNLSDQESSLSDLREAASDALAAVELPPTLAISDMRAPTQPVPKGTTLSVGLTVRNVGDEGAREVTVRRETDVALSPASRSLGALATDETVKATFSGAPEAGQYEVRFRATVADGDGDDATVRFRVVDKATAIGLAQDVLADLIERVDDSEEFTGGTERAALKKLRSAADKLADAADAVERGRMQTADGTLKAASRKIGAFINQVEASEHNGSGNGNGVSDRTARAVANQAEAAIDQIALARDAAK